MRISGQKFLELFFTSYYTSLYRNIKAKYRYLNKILPSIKFSCLKKYFLNCFLFNIIINRQYLLLLNTYALQATQHQLIFLSLKHNTLGKPSRKKFGFFSTPPRPPPSTNPAPHTPPHTPSKVWKHLFHYGCVLLSKILSMEN